MWQQLLACSDHSTVAFCIPWFPNAGGVLPIYWFGILASAGIFVGAFYAARHVETEGQPAEMVWDALLWILLAGLLGARLWYVITAVLGGSTAFSLAHPLAIINIRAGGLNIFGGVMGGAAGMYIYTRKKKLDGWLLADAGLMGLLLGQAIGRVADLINQELYGPPTGSPWWGIRISVDHRLAQFRELPPDTLFHPTMLYEAFWLVLTFAILYTLFRRYQTRIVHGLMTGAYLIMVGLGRFVVETWRPDQPGFTLADGSVLSFSRILSLAYTLVGALIVLDRTDRIRLPRIARPLSVRQRTRDYEQIVRHRQQVKRSCEQEKRRLDRQKQQVSPKSESG